ncbi:hypothetical protein LSH36_744g00037, partial [Paralvinella palmiformis]
CTKAATKEKKEKEGYSGRNSKQDGRETDDAARRKIEKKLKEIKPINEDSLLEAFPDLETRRNSSGIVRGQSCRPKYVPYLGRKPDAGTIQWTNCRTVWKVDEEKLSCDKQWMMPQTMKYQFILWGLILS